MSNDQEVLDRLRGYHDAIPVPAFDPADDVIRGRRRVVQRRVLTAAGAAAAVVAIAATVGALAPRAGDTDTLPALPTATTTPTGQPTPTVTTSASVTVSPTPTATATPTPTSTRADEPEPSETPRPSSTPSATTGTGSGWSSWVSVAGRDFRARLTPTAGDHNQDLTVEDRDGDVFSTTAIYNSEGRWGHAEDRRFVLYASGSRLTDLVSVDGTPVDTEVVGHISVPVPDGEDITGAPYVQLFVTVFRTDEPTTFASGRPSGWVVRTEQGGLWDLSEE